MESNGSLTPTGALPNRFEALRFSANYLGGLSQAFGSGRWEKRSGMSSPTLAESPAFVYWQNRTLRVIPSLNSAPFVSICFAVFLVKSGILKPS
jgi:hypothetical protein